MKNSIKALISFLLLFLLLSMLTVSVWAEGTAPRLMDAARLLTDAEVSRLEAELNAASDRAQFDIVVATVTSLEGADVEQASLDVFDYYDFGYGDTFDGAILLISMQERDWIITSFGWGQEALNARAQEYIGDRIVPSLSAGDYYGAFSEFASLTEEIVTQARAGERFRPPFDLPGSVAVSLVISLIVALIATGVMKGKLKSVRHQTAASAYVKQDSLNVTNARELFLYRNVSRTPKAQDSGRSGGRSPSSGGHVSTHGKF